MDLRSGLKRPQPLAVGRVHRVQHPGEVAHVDDALGDSRGGFGYPVLGAVLPAKLARSRSMATRSADCTPT